MMVKSEQVDDSCHLARTSPMLGVASGVMRSE